MAEKLYWTALLAVLTLTIFWAMWRGWQARRKNTKHFEAYPLPLSSEQSLYNQNLKYVATTVHDEPLERVNSHGLGYRGDASLVIYPKNIVLEIKGEDPFSIPHQMFRKHVKATWTIDRVVEPGGMIVLTWEWRSLLFDTYLRPETAQDSQELMQQLENFQSGNN